MILSKLGTSVNSFGKTLICKLTRSRDICFGRKSLQEAGAFLKPLEKDTVQISEAAKNVAKKGNVLPMEQTMRSPNLIEAYDVEGTRYLQFDGKRFFDVENMKFLPESMPITLEKRIIPKNENVIFISNFEDIPGTIAATTDLSKCIATDKMFQCAGMAVVDKTLNKQTLIHVFPKFSVESNKSLIEKVLAGSKPENLEISIIPGCEYYTEDTVTFLADMAKKLAPGAKVNYCNIPAIDSSKRNITEGLVEFYSGKSAVWMKDGKVYCCNSEEIPNKIVNPREFLTYFG